MYEHLKIEERGAVAVMTIGALEGDDTTPTDQGTTTPRGGDSSSGMCGSDD